MVGGWALHVLCSAQLDCQDLVLLAFVNELQYIPCDAIHFDDAVTHTHLVLSRILKLNIPRNSPNAYNLLCKLTFKLKC